MKKIILSIVVVSMLWGCNQDQQTEQQTETAFNESIYGESFEESNVMTLTQLEKAVQEKDSVEAVVTGEIAASCQSKGCWMDLKMDDNSTMKVTFKDYGFFLPVEDLTGKTVIFSGTAKREFTSVEDQRHYAEDAGKSKEEINAITSPKEELRFVADGVILK